MSSNNLNSIMALCRPLLDVCLPLVWGGGRRLREKDGGGDGKVDKGEVRIDEAPTTRK